METLYVTRDAVLEREGGTLVVRIEGSPKRRFPVETLRHVVVAGETRLTTALLRLAGNSDIRLTILDHYGNAAGSFEPLSSPDSGTVRLAQAQHVLNSELRLDLARRIVRGTMRNLRANLSYRAYRGNDAVRPAVNAIAELERKIDEVRGIEALMGLEGNARSWYYGAWRCIDERLGFGARVRRPPNNPINCLLSWFNGLCYAATRHAIAQTHLDGCLSFLHAPAAARHSLALDLAEPFKPVLTDTLIFESVLRGQIEDAWFHQEDGICRLSEIGRRRTLEMWSTKVEQTGGDSASMRTLMRNEALAIERHVLGISEYKPFARSV
jgi:CRISPR-associated protein Cas1